MSEIININKIHGQTISFRYFADKRLKPKMRRLDGENMVSYPLYVEITVKRQKSQRKSVLNEYVVPERLEQFLRDRADDIKTETNALRERILAYKPFDSASFSLSKTLEGYTVLEEDICYFLGKLFLPAYRDARIADSIELMQSDPLYNLPVLQVSDSGADIYGEEDVFEEFREQAIHIFDRGNVKVHEVIEPLAVFGELRDLAVPGKPNIMKLYQRYNKHFFGIDRYCEIMRDQLKTTVISYSKFVSPEFKEVFLNTFKNDVFDSVYKGLGLLKEEGFEVRSSSK